jgi:hypothetical protein
MSPNASVVNLFIRTQKMLEQKAKYDNKVRQAVLDCILVDKLNATTVQKAMKRDFYLHQAVENQDRRPSNIGRTPEPIANTWHAS